MKNIDMNNFKKQVEKLIKEQKETYKSHDRILADCQHEKSTIKDYNGRQLLELLQNADDEKSTKVLIQLDTTQSILKIKNTGKKCSPFSIEGVKSLMLANLSSKTSGQYIGNKGLGFRSIINWANTISINSNNLELSFSKEIAEKYYKELTTLKQRKDAQQNRNLSDGEIPMAILSIPKIKEIDNQEWKTIISIDCKKEYLEKIEEQIREIKEEILLFLNSLQEIEISIDGESQIIKKPNKKWEVKDDSGEVPSEYLEENDKNNKYKLKIAYNDQLTNDNNNYLFAYFPTKIKIYFPFIVHGTFDLDSSRNQLIDNRKNKFIIERLVDFIIETALNLKQDEVNYQALNFLQYENENEVLEELGFYKKIDEAVKEKKIYPCINNTYRNKNGIVYSNDFTGFIVENKFIENIPYLLKSANESQQTLLNKLKLDGFDSIKKDDIEEVNKKIEDNKVRADFIYHLIINEYQEKLPLLTDENSERINFNDDIYEPATQNFSLPDYVHIRFINKELFGLIKEYDKFSSNWREFVNLRLYNKVEILRKVITSTNKKLEQEDVKTAGLIKSMINCLYENYPDSISISDQNIRLLNQNQELQNAKDLYLSKSYPSGKLTEELFNDIFSNSDFLADISVYELGDDKQKIEDFFLWLGVNKYTKFVTKTIKKYITTPGNYKVVTVDFTEIERFSEIKELPIVNIITWIIADEGIMAKNAISSQLNDLFEGYLISDNNKINDLVNDKHIDYKHPLFKNNNIHKADIDSLLLGKGAVENFNELSFEKIKNVLRSLSEKDPEGKLAQKIYIESFKKVDDEILDNDINLFAEKNGEKSYFSQDEIYYAGNVKLPKEYTNKLAIFNYPKKQDSKGVSEFFKIQDLGEIQTNIVEKKIANIDDEFQSYLKKIKPYILAYRIENLDKDKEEWANKIDNLDIQLSQEISCEIEDQEYRLSDYDYLIDGQRYFIKIPDKNLADIRHEYDFHTTFGDIIGLIFNLENIDKFKNCIKDEEINIERDIGERIGDYAINEAKDLLDINNDFYYFWHTIYELKNKQYTEKHNNNLTLINKELGIGIEDNKIEYNDLSSAKSAEIIINIFQKLKIDILEFNQQFNGKIDLSSYHYKKLKNIFDDNSYQFKQNLHAYCIKHSYQSEFLEKLNNYQASNIDCATQLEIDYQDEFKKIIKKEFGFKLKEIKGFNCEDIFDENKQLLGDDFEHIENNKQQRSWLYFKNGNEEINKYISENKEQASNNKPKQTIIKEINPANFDAPSSNTVIDNSTPNFKGYSQQNKQRKAAGDKAEQIVYDTLVEKFGIKNVKWESRDFPNNNYDFKYKEQEKWWFVEVKTLSNNVFFISKNEKKFAEENKDNYKIFLVGKEIKEIKEIYPVDFNDKNKFSLEAETMSIRYKLKQ